MNGKKAKMLRKQAESKYVKGGPLMRKLYKGTKEAFYKLSWKEK